MPELYGQRSLHPTPNFFEGPARQQLIRLKPRHLASALALSLCCSAALGASEPGTASSSSAPGSSPEQSLVKDVMVLDDLTVYAGKSAQPLYTVANQVSLIERGTLERQQVQELAEIARYLPALDSETSAPRFGFSGLSIRAIGGNRVALESDGVPLPQQYNVGNFADSSRLSLDPAVIQRIEILRGPASVLYGSDAIGGVIIVDTVDADDLVAPGRNRAYQLGAGWYGINDASLVRATVAQQGGKDGLVFSGNRRQGHEADNEARPLGPTSHSPGLIPRDRVDFEQYQAFAKWTHRFVDAGVLRTVVDYYARDSASDNRALLGYARFANTSQILGDDRQQRSRISLNYQRQGLGPLSEFSALLYRQAGDTRQSTQEQRSTRGTPVQLERQFNFRDQAWGGEVKGRLDLEQGSLSHWLVGGVEWDHGRLNESRTGSELNLDSGVSRPVILGENFPLRDFPLTRTDRVGIYLQDTLRWGDWTLIPGLRWDYFNLDARADSLLPASSQVVDLQRDDVTARLGLTWRAARGLSLYSHYSEGFRAPPAADVNLTLDIPQFNIRAIANPDLEPEHSRNFELGLRWQWQGTRIEAAGYYSRYRNFIESRLPLGPDPETGVLLFQSQNIARTRIHGVEVNFSQQLEEFSPSLQHWSVDAAMHWARGDNLRADRPLNSVNPLNAVFGLHWQPQHAIQADLYVRHNARQQRVDFTSAEFFVPPSSTVVDLNLAWQARTGMAWQLGLYNLFDERYWQAADTRGLAPSDPRIEVLSRPGRHVNLTLNLDF